MTSRISHPRRPGAHQLIDAAARTAESVLSAGHRTLGRAELRLHAWRIGRDPEIVEWIRGIERDAAEGFLASQSVEPDLLRKYISAEHSAS